MKEVLVLKDREANLELMLSKAHNCLVESFLKHHDQCSSLHKAIEEIESVMPELILVRKEMFKESDEER